MSGEPALPSPDGGAYVAWLAEIERALDAAHREAAATADGDENARERVPGS